MPVLLPALRLLEWVFLSVVAGKFTLRCRFAKPKFIKQKQNENYNWWFIYQ